MLTVIFFNALWRGFAVFNALWRVGEPPKPLRALAAELTALFVGLKAAKIYADKCVYL
jgi:hypothetical protein